MSQNPNNLPQSLRPAAGPTPASIASILADYVKAGCRIIFWSLIGSAVLAIGYIGLRAIWFACRLATQALGL